MTIQTLRDRPMRGGETPPVRVVVEIEIPARPEDVFSFLADLENNPRWNWAVKSTKSVDGRPPRRGARYRQERLGPGEGYILEITDYRPSEIIEVSGHVAEGAVRYHYRLIPLGPDWTRLLATVELEPDDEMMGTRLYAARLRMAVSANLEDLRHAIEQRFRGGLEPQTRWVTSDPPMCWCSPTLETPTITGVIRTTTPDRRAGRSGSGEYPR